MGIWAYGPGAVHDELLRMITERKQDEAIRKQEEAIKRQAQQQDIENQMRSRQLGQTDSAQGLQRDRFAFEQEQAMQPPPPERPVTMGAGQNLVDPTTGRVITSIPEKPPAPE